MTQEMKRPGPDHPITIDAEPSRIVARVGGTVIADTRAALILREANYPPVYYVPLDGVDPSRLRASATTTHCPYKGEASYYSLVTPDGELTDAVWSYGQPFPAVAAIAGHVAFYPDRVSVGPAEE